MEYFEYPEIRCENCDWEGMENEAGNSGYLNGNMYICPSCGAFDTMEDLAEPEDEEEEEEEEYE